MKEGRKQEGPAFTKVSAGKQEEQEEKGRLVLIDGHAILHRAYHALPKLTTRSGEMVNAVYGFASILLKIIDELKPKYLAVAFDTPKPTFRHREFIGYQVKRPKMDEELAGQIEKVHDLVKAFEIPIFEKEGYEADDVIGTIAKRATGEENKKNKRDKKDKMGLEVIVVTGDRDLLQLVDKKVKLYLPLRGLSEGQIVGEKEVEEKMGVPPKQIVDYKSLVGDQSDNYPGVPGIGPKTAVELLKKFGSLERIFREIRERRERRDIGETILKKLREGEESAFLSKKLARVVTEVPLEFDLEKCQVAGFDKEKGREFFKELGFRSLIRRVSGEEDKKGQKNKKDERQQELF